jgi:SAM-dependent methyltransferase
MGDADYDAKVAQQIARYVRCDIHDIPPIYDYWSNKYLRPKLNSVLGVDSVAAFYVDHILQRTGSGALPEARILSLGAGDAAMEVEIARDLLAKGLRSFRFECMELSPALIDRANRRIQEAGLGAHMQLIQSDLNAWSPGSSGSHYTAVIAHHVLHHLVELEAVFANIAAAIGDNGVFLTSDMIGRNGHMRWPEALTMVNALWDTLPDSLKFNHPFQHQDKTFDNWDCTTEDFFEGVRAQDILPLLLQRYQFEKFLGFGNLPEAFFDRVYGPNFDPSLPAHIQFVDRVEQMNSLLLELGVIKPTMMFAVLSNSGTQRKRFWKNLSPEFSLRDPSDPDLGPARQKSHSLATAHEFSRAVFHKGGDRNGCSLRSGWSSPEEWGVWMEGQEAVLEIPVPAGIAKNQTVELILRARAFMPRRLFCRAFTFLAGSDFIGSAMFCRDDHGVRPDDLPKTLTFAMDAPANGILLLRVIAHEEASPAEDGSPDQRKLSLGLIDLTLR